MNLSEIFNSSLMENAVSFSMIDISISLLVSLVLGIFMFSVYKKTFSGVIYSASFGISLIAMNLITTLVILAVTSNILLSLGMVGALSIVRFRTPIKEPLDIAFLFWAISSGIVVGAGLIPLAVFGTIFIGFILWLLASKNNNDTPYILIVNCEEENTESRILEIIKSKTKKNQIKSKTVSNSGIELTIEIRLVEKSTAFMNELSELSGVTNVVLVNYNGEYLS